ncbi:MAG: hypothetical protein AAF494_02430 [Pseudomonadota bacterium]
MPSALPLPAPLLLVQQQRVRLIRVRRAPVLRQIAALLAARPAHAMLQRAHPALVRRAPVLRQIAALLAARPAHAMLQRAHPALVRRQAMPAPRLNVPLLLARRKPDGVLLGCGWRELPPNPAGHTLF